MASLSHPTGNWAEDTYEAAAAPSDATVVPPTAPAPGEEDSEMSVNSPKLGGATAASDAATAGAAGAAAEDSAGAAQGGEADAKVGKRVVNVDAETDRMARLFLGKEDAEQAKMRLKIVQSNPNSHLSSAKTFDEMGLPPALLKGVQALGFEKPSAIQEMALPLCLMEPPQNLLAQAQSGSGKTAAFCLAGLCRVDTRLGMPQLLIVTPTRELAVQCVQETLVPMAKFMEPPLEVYSALKGVHPPREGVRAHVVVGTPGSIVGALDRRKLLLTHCVVFVLDEADAMLEDSGEVTGHRSKCIQIKQRYLPPLHQTLLFSATFPREVKQFGLMLAESPVNEITLPDEQDLVLDVITQLWIDLRNTRQSRLELIQELYDVLEMGQSIIFCRTKEEANQINVTLQTQGFTCSILHGGLDGDQRDETMDQFRLGHNKVLLTTNVLARGVDVPAVSLVVNYDMPTIGYSRFEPDPDTYLHRIGRTGRFGRRGVAINLIEDEDAHGVLQAIDRHFSPANSMIRQASTDVEELEKIIVEESKKRVVNRDDLAMESS
eukprot:g10373.t1